MKRRLLVAGTATALLLLFLSVPVAAQQQSGDDQAANRPSRDDQQHQQQQQDNQRQQRQKQQSSDDGSTEYRGDERAALGVMLSEDRNGQVKVTQVISDSPAERAGIQRGDKISKIDDQDVSSYRDVIHSINRKDPDEKVSITIERDGESKQMNVSLDQRQDVFSQGSQFTQQRARERYDDRFGRQTSRRDQWQQDSWQQDTGRSDDRRRQDEERWPEQGDRYPGPQDRGYQDQYSRGGYEQYREDQMARRDRRGRDDRWSNQYGQSGNLYDRQEYSQRDRSGQRQQDRPTLGIALRLDRGNLRVSQVYRGSPADEAGLRPGDQIVAVDGRQVRTYDQLLNTLGRNNAGDRVSVSIVRNGRRQQVEARLEDDAYARNEQNWQRQPSSQDRQGYSQDRRAWDDGDRWEDRQGYDVDQEQRTGSSEFGAGRKQIGEPYDSDFSYPADRDF